MVERSFRSFDLLQDESGIIDINVYHQTSSLVKKIAYYIDRKDNAFTENLYAITFGMLHVETGMENTFNNIYEASPYPALNDLSVKINKYVKPTLSHLVNQSLQWNYKSEEAFITLSKVLFTSSSSFLERLLTKTNLKIAVYNGNLDAVAPLAGASNWVHKLKWHGAEQFRNAKRFRITGERNGFYKEAGRLSFCSVFGAGHWVPEENPVAMEQILNYVVNGK